MQHNQIISNERRRITDTYTLENNYRIKISTYHDRIKKVYWSTISECIVHASDTPGFYFERHRMHADLNKLLVTAPGLRYSSKDLQVAHNTALNLGVDLRDQFLTANADISAAELVSL